MRVMLDTNVLIIEVEKPEIITPSEFLEKF
jgi:predicted nucleic acid-binding protein